MVRPQGHTYEDHRNLKTGVENAFNTALVSNYTYQYDNLGRRTNTANTGQAFAQAGFNVYDYNHRSEVTGSERYEGTDVTDLSMPIDPERRLYAYDPIGNRDTAAEGTDPATAYATNSTNQYTTVGASSLTYDADGNLTGKDGATYTWNAENRLVSVAPQTPATGDKKVEYVYDYLGRRVKKAVYTFNATSYQLSATSLYVYDGWNLIEELDNTGAAKKSYAWGLDLTQSLQGAGGVGGLLAMTDGTDAYLYCHDANGNVGQMVNAADGSIAAHYEYDPFGKTIRADGDMAEENPFRFSTKYADEETGLYYYGYRYYEPGMGRWLSRDPIGEDGGLNLYAVALNNPVSFIDILGRWMPDTHKDITEQSFDKAKSVLQSDSSDFPVIIEDMKKRIVYGNLSQDYLHLLDHRRHYSYTGEKDENEVAEVGSAYDRYLEEERDRFDLLLENPNLQNCADALKSLGRLSHTWQDYYGHGVLKGNDLTVEKRRDIGSRSFVYLGTPEKRGDLVPASWSWNPLNNSTEHPSLFHGEPVKTGTGNYYIRKEEAGAGNWTVC